MHRIVVGVLSLLLLVAEKVRAGKLSLTDTITWGGDNGRTGYQPKSSSSHRRPRFLPSILKKSWG